jgi:hypothetical protein
MRASWIGPRPYQEVDSIDRPEIGLKSAECERVVRTNDLDRSEIALKHQCERTFSVMSRRFAKVTPLIGKHTI